MRAGLLNQVIKVYRPTTTINSLGEQTTTYHLHHSYRARIVPRSRNRENIQGDITYINRHELQVRIHCDIQDYDIILFQGHYYRIIEAPLEDRATQSKSLNIAQIEGEVSISLAEQENGENTQENNG